MTYLSPDTGTEVGPETGEEADPHPFKINTSINPMGTMVILIMALPLFSA
jgi:hypothetical protein